MVLFLVVLVVGVICGVSRMMVKLIRSRLERVFIEDVLFVVGVGF